MGFFGGSPVVELMQLDDMRREKEEKEKIRREAQKSKKIKKEEKISGIIYYITETPEEKAEKARKKTELNEIRELAMKNLGIATKEEKIKAREVSKSKTISSLIFTIFIYAVSISGAVAIGILFIK
jgi:hypothetical protein